MPDDSTRYNDEDQVQYFLYYLEHLKRIQGDLDKRGLYRNHIEANKTKTEIDNLFNIHHNIVLRLAEAALVESRK